MLPAWRPPSTAGDSAATRDAEAVLKGRTDVTGIDEDGLGRAKGARLPKRAVAGSGKYGGDSISDSAHFRSRRAWDAQPYRSQDRPLGYGASFVGETRTSREPTNQPAVPHGTNCLSANARPAGLPFSMGLCVRAYVRTCVRGSESAGARPAVVTKRFLRRGRVVLSREEPGVTGYLGSLHASGSRF